jgi:hypothetical protein
MAAVLACGPGALLSHRSAADLWGLRRTARHDIDVIAPGRSRHQRSGITVHRPRRLEPADASIVDGVPVTAIPRTLVDLASVVNRRQLARAFEQADRLGLLHVDDVEAVCERSRGRRGVGTLRAIIAAAKPASAFLRSELERRFLELCDEAGLPRPSMNLFTEGFEVDASWPDQRVVVELDGWEYHRTHADFERDRARDARLEVAGYRVVRFTDKTVETDAAGVVDTVRRLLGSAGTALHPPMLHSVK